MNEIWKPIPNLHNLYEVSNFGNVRSYCNNKWGIRSEPKNINGLCGLYKTVALKTDTGIKTFYVHRLVAENFIPNPDNLSEVNHIDGDKLNNNVSNLEWTSHKGNMEHALNHSLLGKCKKIYCVETGETFVSITDFGKHIGISESYANVIINKKGGIYKNRTYIIKEN